MKIKSESVRQLRAKKLWSQQQLADACGLGLRTIQRLEKEGNASYETIRAIASVFEVDVNSLVINQTPFQGYFHRQIGYTTMITVVVAILLVSGFIGSSVMGTMHEDKVMLVVLGTSALVMLFVFSLFSSLSVRVSNDKIQWYFSFGFWRKSLPLDEVQGCEIVQNAWWNGFGIRMLGNGWLYNVSDLQAVEIKLRGGSCVRLGTDEPEYLANAIDLAMTQLHAASVDN